MNALIEASSRAYKKRMEAGWTSRSRRDPLLRDLARQPALGGRARRAVGGVVYHDVTERRWAQKALDAGVHGFIA
jgi:nitronate monooxygenase